MSTPLIVVTGKNGQLGNAIAELSPGYADRFRFLFTAREDLDITDPQNLASFFEKYKPSYFINCAAYTAVDKAETEQETAYTVNAEANGMIARQCRSYKCSLLFISTDYVFDGKAAEPYQPGDKTDPVNYYGYTKLMGEKLALENNPDTIVIRTSWVYSAYGHNFVKTMLRLMKEKDQVSVVNDQSGSPTHAADLADALLRMIASLENGNRRYGIYHYSNKGVITWYDFAVAIRDMAGLECAVHPIPTTSFPTPAKRPSYSVLDTSALGNDFPVAMLDWKKSLRVCLDKLV